MIKIRNAVCAVIGVVLLFAVLPPVSTHAAGNISKEQADVLYNRVKDALLAGENYIDVHDMQLTVDMYADRFSPEYQRALDAVEKARSDYGTFVFGENKEDFCLVSIDTEPTENADEFGVGENNLIAVEVFYNPTYQNPDGTCDVTHLNHDRAIIEREYQAALSVVEESMCDAEKALVLYDYLIALLNYPDHKGFDEKGFMTYESKYHDVANVFCEKMAVCDAYALAYVYLLNDCGIDAVTVSCEDIQHEWAMVKIDGTWYHADLTWDDSRYPDGWTECEEHNADPWDIGAVNHKYFLKSDQEIMALEHPNWRLLKKGTSQVSHTPKADRSNAFQQEFFFSGNDWSNTRFNYIGGRWYFLNRAENCVMETTYGTSDAPIKKIDRFDEQIYYVHGDGTYLYLCTCDNIYRFNPATDELQPVMQASSLSDGAQFSEMSVASNLLTVVAISPSESTKNDFDSRIIETNLENLQPLQDVTEFSQSTETPPQLERTLTTKQTTSNFVFGNGLWILIAVAVLICAATAVFLFRKRKNN
ncbi:MAG: hypothetical protein IIY71_00070 [Oscillospiraceae bacterium]|nr:hypothetical protein [Oscillospiraceae bacterium]